MKRARRILIVAMPDSIHTARWVNQIGGKDWDVYLFPVYVAKPHPELRKVTFFASSLSSLFCTNKELKIVRWTIPFFLFSKLAVLLGFDRNSPGIEKALSICLKLVRPQIVHTLELQHAGYLLNSVKKKSQNGFPKWIISLWGSDLFLFGRLKKHQIPVETCLKSADYLISECPRDYDLAVRMGFSGSLLPSFPGPGGFHHAQIENFSKYSLPSNRRKIILKGYQSWAGRALFGLSALKECIEVLTGYSIAVFSASEDVAIAAELFEQETGILVEVVPKLPRDRILEEFAQSRLYIGLSISDGLPNSMLEAMATGAFPIQSSTACVEGWIVDGENGFIVPPEDTSKIAECIRRALTDDELVDHAAKKNLELVKNKLDYSSISSSVIKMYDQIFLELRN